MMPRLNGIKAMTQVREFYKDWNEQNNMQLDVPEIVFLTAYKTKGFDRHMRDLGVSLVFEKPMTLDEMKFIFGLH